MKSRFAPSPTGYLHIGGARTALFAWLWAKKTSSKFVLRIEDTDKERSTQTSVDAILDGMEWLGLDYDEGPIYQSDRTERYNEVINELLLNGKAYYCDCSKDRLEEMRENQIAKKEKPKYDGCCRDKALKSGVIRFLNPDDGSVIFNDFVKGEVRITNSEIDDLIISRTDGSPTYNLTVVVDDHDMEIDCVIRGDDHINNTPKQINLYKAMGWPLPEFAHVPMILGSDGSRLSKRHGALNLLAYRDEGFLPEALLNYIVRLGWSNGDQEIFSVQEMIDLFELKNINNSPASFNQEKLEWINQSYIKSTDINNLVENLKWHLNNLNINEDNGPSIYELAESLRERSRSLVDMALSCVMFYCDFDTFDSTQANKVFNTNSKSILEDLVANLNSIDSWTAENIHSVIKIICDERTIGFGKVGQPFRLALSGDGKSGSIDISAQFVGKERTLARLEKAIDWINNHS
ncbi:glutamate--tRNA ligase [Candidatus Pseudothioglobus singularis]|nr:glutamate--tRNA ligase [Candidatus Pseudothioglobus singularis]MDB4598789.1 glutamate--tRNA ligase [Candidatus Pseudothioglobus singularis]